ncbi:uncharacterized protein LOC130744845 [Lotus japonicus]|uniref:uncharacterized protein LOC130744845 n=1 Tax=Lotus japonicus TaxID=34305 RepID=UPI002587D724|nr:uncharacterized protein LOC130744845 [Lotus japonicus]
MESRKRIPKPVASASQKRAKGVGVSTPSGASKLASDAQTEVADKEGGGGAAIQTDVHEHSTSNPPSRENSPAPIPAKSKTEGVEKPPKAASSAKKTPSSEGRRKVRSKSRHKSPRRSRSSTNSSPSKDSACQVSLYFSCFADSFNMRFTLSKGHKRGFSCRRLRVQLLPSAKQSPFQAKMTALCLLQNRLPLCNIRLKTKVALHLMCLVKSSTLYLRRTRWQLWIASSMAPWNGTLHPVKLMLLLRLLNQVG